MCTLTMFVISLESLIWKEITMGHAHLKTLSPCYCRCWNLDSRRIEIQSKNFVMGSRTG